MENPNLDERLISRAICWPSGQPASFLLVANYLLFIQIVTWHWEINTSEKLQLAIKSGDSLVGFLVEGQFHLWINKQKRVRLCQAWLASLLWLQFWPILQPRWVLGIFHKDFLMAPSSTNGSFQATPSSFYGPIRAKLMPQSSSWIGWQNAGHDNAW